MNGAKSETKLALSSTHPFGVIRQFWNELSPSLTQSIFTRLRVRAKVQTTTVDRVTTEVKEALGLTGFTLRLDLLQLPDELLGTLWNALSPHLESPGFEEATEKVLAEARTAARNLTATARPSAPDLQPEELFQLQAGLDFYQYLLPRLALVATILQRLLGNQASTEKPAPEDLSWQRVDSLFTDLRRFVLPGNPNRTTQTRKLWHRYLDIAGDSLKPIQVCPSHQRAVSHLHSVTAREAAQLIRTPGSLELDLLRASIGQALQQLEKALPHLILNLSILNLQCRPATRLIATAIPIPYRTVAPDVAALPFPKQRRQPHLAEAAEPRLAPA